MVKITFKNVGQGDSIILEWREDNINKIGIIDCNIFNGTNPVLNYVRSLNCLEIEFVLLSHPHYDHFSGFIELFKWCDKNKIHVKYFLHTSLVTTQYFLTALKTYTAKSTLDELFILIREYNTSIHSIDDDPHRTKKIDDWILTFLSPSRVEIDNYIKGINTYSREENFHNNPNGNWLSTLVKLKKNDKCILLTSDIEKSTLSRLKSNKRISESVVLAQVPHHGSKKSHNEKFWSFSRRKPNTPIAISVGKNKYNHPSNYVIKKFEGLQYKINRTDELGINYQNLDDYQNVFIALDSISDIVDTSQNNEGNDLVFELD